jgi:hypothetical protein
MACRRLYRSSVMARIEFYLYDGLTAHIRNLGNLFETN